MKIVAYGKDNYIGLWTYLNFQEHHKATVINYNLIGNLINYIIYDLEKVDDKYLKNSGITYEVEEE